jgi:hypothetical protein
MVVHSVRQTTASARAVLAAVAAAWALATIGRVALPRSGLVGEYFDNPLWSGASVRSSVDPDLTTMQLSRGWNYLPPEIYSVRWSGYLSVGSSGDYRFVVRGDDRVVLWIDELSVAEGGVGGAASASSRTVRLTAGTHAVRVDYAQTGGAYELECAWASGSGSPQLLPAWRLSPQPTSIVLLAARHAVMTAWPVLTALLLALIAHAAVHTGRWPRPLDGDRADLDAHASAPPWTSPPASSVWRSMGTRQGVAALGLFAVLAIIHTWPLASAPGRLSRNDNADTVLNEWTLAWVAHEAPRDPVRLFDAPIFHPERRTLAYSEPLLLQSLFAAPLFAFGASPVLAYNVVLLAGMALSGWALCLVLVRWTGSWVAGLVAGIALAFNAHTLTRMPHLQIQHTELFPLALLAFDALLCAPRWSRAMGLAVTVVGQALASIYLWVFTVIALAVAFLSRPEDWMDRRGLRVGLYLGAAALVTGAALAPLFLPYWQLRGDGFFRSIDEATFFAASVRDYVTTPARWYPWGGGGLALFPGAVSLALALVAVGTGIAARDPRARMCFAFAVAGVLLSFGPAVVPGYETLHTTFPPLQAVRMTARFGYLGIVGIAVLAGFGAAIIDRRGAGRSRLARAGALVLLAALEPLAAPLSFEPFSGINPIYARLQDEPTAVVVELPYPNEDRVFANARYLLNATAHWRPMLNGYSGFVPRSYVARFPALQTFPSEVALTALHAAGVTHVFVHLDAYDASTRAKFDAEPALRRLEVVGNVALYALSGAPHD